MNRRKGMGVGSVSLVLLFSVMCLTVFALLSLGTARSETNLAQRAADSAKSFYAADTEAELIYSELIKAVIMGEKPETVRETDIEYVEDYIRFFCPLTDDRAIAVVILSDGTIVQWKETDDESWVPDESVNVWKEK